MYKSQLEIDSHHKIRCRALKIHARLHCASQKCIRNTFLNGSKLSWKTRMLFRHWLGIAYSTNMHVDIMNINKLQSSVKSIVCTVGSRTGQTDMLFMPQIAMPQWYRIQLTGYNPGTELVSPSFGWAPALILYYCYWQEGCRQQASRMTTAATQMSLFSGMNLRPVVCFRRLRWCRGHFPSSLWRTNVLLFPSHGNPID